MSALDARLTALLEPTVNALGYECVGVVRAGSRETSIVRVYIDSERGIGIEDCERVSHQVSGVLDVADPLPGHYSLEVSSPGIDRPLYREADFRRFSGAEVRLRTRAPIDGQRRFRGRLGEVGDGEVVIAVDGRDINIALEAIEEARLVPDV